MPSLYAAVKRRWEAMAGTTGSGEPTLRSVREVFAVPFQGITDPPSVSWMIGFFATIMRLSLPRPLLSFVIIGTEGSELEAGSGVLGIRTPDKGRLDSDLKQGGLPLRINKGGSTHLYLRLSAYVHQKEMILECH
jgi:hypothetical protein